jgi:PAS domain-containing protein
MEKLDAALNNMSHGLCMFGPDNRLLLWNDRYVKMYKLAPDRLRVGFTLDEMLEARKAAGTAYRVDDAAVVRSCARARERRRRLNGKIVCAAREPLAPRRLQCIASSAFDEAPAFFLACLPLRKRISISVPLTRTSSHRR